MWTLCPVCEDMILTSMFKEHAEFHNRQAKMWLKGREEVEDASGVNTTTGEDISSGGGEQREE